MPFIWGIKEAEQIGHQLDLIGCKYQKPTQAILNSNASNTLRCLRKCPNQELGLTRLLLHLIHSSADHSLSYLLVFIAERWPPTPPCFFISFLLVVSQIELQSESQFWFFGRDRFDFSHSSISYSWGVVSTIFCLQLSQSQISALDVSEELGMVVKWILGLLFPSYSCSHPSYLQTLVDC